MATITNNIVTNYFRSSWEELKKVTWPSKAETLRYSLAVIIMCAVVATYFGALDWALNKGLEALVSVTS